MQTATAHAAETTPLAAECDPISRMVQFLMEDDAGRRGVWTTPTKDQNDFERRRRLWQDREMRARAMRRPQ